MAGRCPECRNQIPIPSLPYEFKGDRLGMSVDEFKQKHHRTASGHDEVLPWCSDTRPGEAIDTLLSQPWFSEAGIVHCRLNFPFEQSRGEHIPTVAGVKAELLLYQFVDDLLFRVSAWFETERFDDVRNAIQSKYGEPSPAADKRTTFWSNGISTIVLTKGKRKNQWITEHSCLHFVHTELQELAENRRPGPAVADL